MNKQREVIYARRRDLLSRDDLGDDVLEMAEGLAADLVASHCSDEVAPDEWDRKTLDDAVFAQFNLRLGLVEAAAGCTRAAQVEEMLPERVRQAYAEREAMFTPPVMRHLESVIWLQTLDTLWKDHLLSMDHLKEGIGLRGYGQKNPLQEYQKEGYDLFEELVRRMEADVVEKLMSVQLQAQPAAAQARPAAALDVAVEGGDFEPPMPAAVADPSADSARPRPACGCPTARRRRVRRRWRRFAATPTRWAATSPARAAAGRSTRSATAPRREGARVKLPRRAHRVRVPGFRFAGVRAGFKTRGPDVALIALDAPGVAAGVLTTNRVKAAPVVTTRARLRTGNASAVLVHAGTPTRAPGARGCASSRCRRRSRPSCSACRRRACSRAPRAASACRCRAPGSCVACAPPTRRSDRAASPRRPGPS